MPGFLGKKKVALIWWLTTNIYSPMILEAEIKELGDLDLSEVSREGLFFAAS